MQKILVTNGGPHSSDVWAELTANTIVDTILVDASPDDASAAAIAARAAKRKLRADLFEIFNDHFTDVQGHERGECKKHKKIEEAAAHAAASLDVTEHMTSVTEAVNAIFKETPFADHMAKPEVQAVVASIIGQFTADAMHIERRHHHDKVSKKGA